MLTGCLFDYRGRGPYLCFCFISIFYVSCVTYLILMLGAWWLCYLLCCDVLPDTFVPNASLERDAALNPRRGRFNRVWVFQAF